VSLRAAKTDQGTQNIPWTSAKNTENGRNPENSSHDARFFSILLDSRSRNFHAAVGRWDGLFHIFETNRDQFVMTVRDFVTTMSTRIRFTRGASSTSEAILS